MFVSRLFAVMTDVGLERARGVTQRHRLASLATEWVGRVLENHLAGVVLCIVAVELVAIYLWFQPGANTDYYDDVALNLLEGRGYITGVSPVFFMTPGYILLLAGIFAIAGQSAVAVFVVQLLLYLLFLILLYLTAERYASRRVAQLTILGTASYPLLAYYTFFYHPEILFTFAFGVFIWAALRALTARALWNSFCAGALLALCSLIKPFIFYYWPLFLLVAWRQSAGGHRRAGRAVALVAGVFLTVAPWTIRNYLASGQFLLLATGGGFSLWQGNVVETDGLDKNQLSPEEQRLFESLLMKEIGVLGTAHTIANDRQLGRVAIARMLAEPLATARRTGRKALRLWWSPHRPERRRYGLWFGLLHIPLVLAALWVFANYEFSGRGVLLSLFVYFQVVYALVSPTVRYAVPLVPYLILTAAWGWEMTFNAAVQRKR